MNRVKFFTGFLCLLCLSATPLFSEVKGDVNNDTNINIVDALMTAQYTIGIQPVNFDADAADVNWDKTITIVDALMIAQYSVGVITEFGAVIVLNISASDDMGYTGSGYIAVSPMSLEKTEKLGPFIYGTRTFFLHFLPGTTVTFTGVTSGKAYFQWAARSNPVSLIVQGGETLTGYFIAPDPTPRPR